MSRVVKSRRGDKQMDSIYPARTVASSASSLVLLGQLLLTPLWLMPVSTHAAIFSISDRPNPSLKLRVGGNGGTINEVDFTVGANELGNGNPVTGSPVIRIVLRIRAALPASRVATLTVDSSSGLSNGGNSLLFSSISWTARDGDIPSGMFDNSNAQFVVSFLNSQRIVDRHTFIYDNAGLLEAGDYTGRITYTLTMP